MIFLKKIIQVSEDLTISSELTIIGKASFCALKGLRDMVWHVFLKVWIISQRTNHPIEVESMQLLAKFNFKSVYL